MALKVWLPLTGNLDNQGSSNVVVSSDGATVDNAGKVGKCVKVVSTTNLKHTPDFNSEDLTLSGWFKFNKAEISSKVSTLTYTESANAPTGNLLGNNSYGGIGIIWRGNNMYTAGEFSNMTVFGCLRTPSVGSKSTSSFTVPFDVWVHIVLTWSVQTKKLSLYKDGVLVGVVSISGFSDGVLRAVSLDSSLVYGGSGPGTTIPLYANDVRIYDHCLSAREVQEIAKGLVYHYPMSDSYTTDKIYSVAGYGGTLTLSGTVTNNIEITENSPRYSRSTHILNGKTGSFIGNIVMPESNSEATVNCWFKSDTAVTQSVYNAPIGIGSKGRDYQIVIGPAGKLYAGFVINGTRSIAKAGSVSCLDGNWHMLTATYDGETIRRYVDSVQLGTTTVTGSLTGGTLKCWVGQGSSDTVLMTASRVSDIRIYTTALTTTQIEELYNNPVSVCKGGTLMCMEVVE